MVIEKKNREAAMKNANVKPNNLYGYSSLFGKTEASLQWLTFVQNTYPERTVILADQTKR